MINSTGRTTSSADASFRTICKIFSAAMAPISFIGCAIVVKGGEAAGFFRKLWKKGLAEYDEMEGIAWRWQSIDCAMTKAPAAQESVGPNPTDREKNGTKRHILVDERGVPLSIVVTGANRHDVTQVDEVLKNRIRKPGGASSNIFARMLGTPEKNQKKP